MILLPAQNFEVKKAIVSPCLFFCVLSRLTCLCLTCLVPDVLRALRALVLDVPRALRALVPDVLHALHDLTLHVPRTLPDYVSRTLHALVSHVLRVLRPLVPNVPRALTCSCASSISYPIWEQIGLSFCLA